jgi:predicted lipid-binding transport protein (Tim44 family)
LFIRKDKMLITNLWRRVQAVSLVALLLPSLILMACGAAAEPATEEASPTDTATAVAPTAAQETATAAPQAQTTEEAEPAETPQQEQAIASAGAVSCESFEIPTNNLIAPASAEDWAKGPADASVTVIEYGDFQ